MKNHTVVVAALAALSLFACAEADTSDTAQKESPVVMGADDRFAVEFAEPTPFAHAAPSKADFKSKAAAEPSPSYAGPAAITAEQKAGAAVTPPVAAAADIQKFALPIDECRATYICTGAREILLRPEGGSCLFGEIVLESNWTAQWREQKGTWMGNAEFIDITFDGVTSRCQRKD